MTIGPGELEQQARDQIKEKTMTREEAIKIARQGIEWYSKTDTDRGRLMVEMLEKLGLLKLSPSQEHIEAARILDGFWVRVESYGIGMVTPAGAQDIISLLTKSGFKITKDK